MIEQMKKNEKLFSRLSDDERDCLIRVGKINCCWWTGGCRWHKIDAISAPHPFNGEVVYRINKDYLAEPRFDKQAVYISNDEYGIMSCTNSCTIFCSLSEAANQKGFMYYEYENGTKSPCSRILGCTNHPAKYPKYVVFSKE